MKINKFYVSKIFFVVSVSLFMYGCCSKCNKNIEEDKFVKGYITVVGNEPFSKLALKTDNNQIFLLQLSATLEKKLWEKQGFYFHVAYSKLTVNEGVTTIVVEKASPLNQENK